MFNNELAYSYTITLHDDKIFDPPYDISLDTEGYLYVAEYRNRCVTKLTLTGQYNTRFCSRGSAPGHLNNLSSLSFHNNLVYVSKMDNGRVSIFDVKGNFIYCFSGSGIKTAQ